MNDERFREIEKILEFGKMVLDIEKIIMSTKYMKQHQKVISVMKTIKNELVNEISNYYKEPTYSVDNSTITLESLKEKVISEPILEPTPESDVKYTTEEVSSVEEPVNVNKYKSNINSKIKESLAHDDKVEDIQFSEEAKIKNEDSTLVEVTKEKRKKPNVYSKKKK
ncbi:MAG: hypothetical protein PVG30_02090 [Gammaproteobacteria bacterium]|jgi:hypothetical protein